MQDNTPKGNIDLDDLVSTLIRERAGSAPAAEEEFSPPTAAVELPSAAVEEAETPLQPPAPVADVPVTPAQVFASSVEDEPEDEDEAEDTLPSATGEKKSLWQKLLAFFSRRAEESEEDTEEEWADWGLKPIGHYHVEDAAEKPAQPAVTEPVSQEPVNAPGEDTGAETPAPEGEKTGVSSQEPAPVSAADAPDSKVKKADTKTAEPVDEFPAVQAVDETITLPVIHPQTPPADDVTRVITLPGSETPAAPVPAAMPAVPDDQLPNQLTLEEILRVEDMDDAVAVTDEDPEERLQRARQEKIRDFTLNGDEEEDNEPEEEAEEEAEEEPEIEDFTGYQDTKSVLLELRYRCRTAMLGLLFTGLLELLLLVLTALTLALGQSPITEMGYLTVQLFSLGLMLVLNYTAVARGLSGLFTLRANGDTGPALVVVIALCNVGLHFVKISETLPFWAPVAGLVMLLHAAGSYINAMRIRRNFAFVAYPGVKYTACLIEDEKALHEIGRRAVIEGDADVAYFRPAGFLSDYLSNAGEEDRSDDWMRWMAPVALALSLILSLVLVFSGMLTGFWDWMRAFVGMICVSMPVASLAVQLSLSQCCRYMLARGGFMVGWKAVRQFGSPDALAVDVADLYPDESMLLHGIKTFGGTHIDDAILDAASLAVRSEGPLSLIFRRIIENKEQLLRAVDNLVYEQGMGLSGWVNDRRVLVGNRRLLQHHGVDVPSSDYEARYAKDGRRLVYLATAGELSAMFVVSYLPDESIKDALQDLCRSKVTLLVRSCDPNITAEDLCRDFELDDYYVDMLPTAAGRLYVQLTEGEAETAPAVMASNGHILGTALVLAACRSLQVKSLIALLVQTVLAVLGLILCTLWIASGSMVFFLAVLLYVAATALLSFVLPLFRRI